MNRDTVAPYNRGFREFSASFDSFRFEELHRGALPFLPAVPGLALDVGAGSGRDARWLAARGWEVVAVEPAVAMREQAASHPGSGVRWLDDRLPALAGVHRLGLAFDLVWLSGVWMHVPPEDRRRAMRKMATLLKPGGRLVMTLRHGPAAEDRPMWPVDAHEVERLGLDFGLTLRVATDLADDLQGRADVRWQTVILDLPDDGAGALPLLRGVILRQEKSATYKLALIRCIARIADASANVARETDEHVELPLGLIALYWIRMYKPLVEHGLPQLPQNRPMAFVTDAFRALHATAPFDLRPGGVFGEGLRRALGQAGRLIADMPATHLTFADNSPVFPTRFGKSPARGEFTRISLDMLWRYGVTRVPSGIWQALRRMAAWVEPMLVAEWLRLTKDYAARAGDGASADVVLDALRWIEPGRDTSLVRDLTAQRLNAGRAVTCVWSGDPLGLRNLDIDHCLPWSAWACGDLWNLLPTGRAINQHQKRDLIVSAATLREAKPRIQQWWQEGYLDGSPALRARFTEEARTTLPIGREGDLDVDELFLALDFRRLRLRQETQLPEWTGHAG